MMSRLSDALSTDPGYLAVRDKHREEKIKHLAFNVVEDGDIISMPLCGTIKRFVTKYRPRNVTCQSCLDCLDAISGRTYVEAVDYLKTVHPRVLTPDVKIMRHKIGGQPTLTAQKHLKAAVFLKDKFADTPDDLIFRALGSERTFYVNLYEFGMINKQGEKTGFTARDLASGKSTRQSILENE